MTVLEKIVYNTLFGKKKNKSKLGPGWGEVSLSAPEENQLILGEGVYSNLYEGTHLSPNNTLVIGSAGTGKSRCYIEPNLLSGNTNYVIVDRGGVLHDKYASTLKAMGFEVKCVDAYFESEDCVNFNPFAHLTETDILPVAKILARGCQVEDRKGDPFFDKQAEMVLESLICYVKDIIPKKEQSLLALYKVFKDKICARDDDSSEPNVVENYLALKKEYCEKFPDGYGVACFRMACEASTGETLKSTFINLGVNLFSWLTTMYDKKEHLANQEGIDFASFRNQKSALFLNLSAHDCTFTNYCELCLWQAYKYFIENDKGSKYLVHFVLDEFANYRVLQLDAFLAIGRSSGVFTSIIVQCIDQLRAVAGEKYDMFLGNSTNLLFLGGVDLATHDFVSQMLGRTVVTDEDTSDIKTFVTSEKSLMFPDELRYLPASDCIVIKRGEKPYYAKKFDVSKHPNFPKEK